MTHMAYDREGNLLKEGDVVVLAAAKVQHPKTIICITDYNFIYVRNNDTDERRSHNSDMCIKVKINGN